MLMSQRQDDNTVNEWQCYLAAAVRATKFFFSECTYKFPVYYIEHACGRACGILT